MFTLSIALIVLFVALSLACAPAFVYDFMLDCVIFLPRCFDAFRLLSCYHHVFALLCFLLIINRCQYAIILLPTARRIEKKCYRHCPFAFFAILSTISFASSNLLSKVVL